MPRQKKLLLTKKPAMRNKIRPSTSFMDHIRTANRNAHAAVNRNANTKSQRTIKAALAQADEDDYGVMLPWPQRIFRWCIALILLPICFVTSQTFIGQFADQALGHGFWHSKEFWFFATGALSMAGWFFTGLLRTMFLFLYVLGHELTHAVFVYLHLGRVSGFSASSQGGYITTNKSNILISLSPYFVPFWSCVILLLFPLIRLLVELPSYAEEILYGLTGFTWTFHLLWTLWMIPRDQPDLKENDTFFSIVLIYLINILLLATLLCIASPKLNALGFIASWRIHAENSLRYVSELAQNFTLF